MAGPAAALDPGRLAHVLRILGRAAEEIGGILADASTDLELLDDEETYSHVEVETVALPAVSPDCAAGKCPACTGDAWDTGKDRLIDCQHDCHHQGAGHG